MRHIVILSGSPSEQSRSELALSQVGKDLRRMGYESQFYTVRDFSPETLFHARFEDPKVIAFVRALSEADGAVIGSPVYKASYTGVLKALLDLLPKDALIHTPVLPMMVGGSSNHLLALEYALKPLLANMKGELLHGIYLLDHQIDPAGKPPIRDSDMTRRIEDQLNQLIQSIEQKKAIKARIHQ